MEEPKQLSVSELRKKFESNKSSAPSTTTTSKPLQSTVSQSTVNNTRQAFPANSQPNGATDNQSTQPDTSSMSVKERMKMFDKSKNAQPLPSEPRKSEPSVAIVNNNQNETTPVSTLPEKSEPVAPLQELVHENPELQDIPQEEEQPQVEEVSAPVQEEKIQEIQEQVQEVEIPEAQNIPQEIQEPQVEEIVAPVQEEKIEEILEQVQEVQEVKESERIEKEEEQQEQVPSKIEEQNVVEKEETKTQEIHNPVLNRNAGFASEMNAMLAKKGLRSTEESPIKPEQPKHQGLRDTDAYTEVLLTRPTAEARNKKKAKLVFVDEDF